MHKSYRIAALILVTILLIGKNALAQDNVKTSLRTREKQRKAMHSRDSLIRSLNNADTSVNSLILRLGQYNTTFNQVSNNLANGLDTADISLQCPSAINRLNKIRVLTNTHKSSTLRYLFVLRDNLDHLQETLKDWQSDLNDISIKLIQNQKDLLSFSKDSLIKSAPTDSALKKIFFAKRKATTILWEKTDADNRKALLKVNLLQDKVGTLYSDMLDETDQIDSKIQKFAVRAVTGEFDYIWKVDSQYNDFKSALAATISLNNTQLYYFFRGNSLTHFAGFAFLIFIFGWVFFNRIKTKRNHPEPGAIFEQTNYIYKLPLASCLLIVAAIVPYFYDHPPVIFLELFFLLSLVLVLILVKEFYHKSLFDALLALFWLTIAYSVSNLLIETTNADRYTVLFLSIASIVIGWVFLKKVKADPEGYLANTGVALRIFIVLQFLSLVCNISGRFSLAKIIGVTAVYNLWFLATLYFVVQIILQGLFLQFQRKKDENSLMSYVDYSLMEVKFKKLLTTLAGLLWLFFLLQNLNVEDAATDYVSDILDQSRTVAGASFTVGGFVIFVGVIWLSSILSRIVSYFYDVSAQRSSVLDSLKKKNRTSTLLIRIGVFTVGFFLAIAASNFPLDKITIIISAFGIGIGFGLQNIVNNLVSGMILAFEKPIQIGDIIEVDGRSGSVKEIGIRSSKLATYDGAEVIIPNADLISHHVINWTLSNNNRRVEIMISVAYGADIEKVKAMLLNLLLKRKNIMIEPKPLVFLHNLSKDTVDFRLLFWADDIETWVGLKSQVLIDMYTALTEAGIPLPQQDVHVYLAENQSLKINRDIDLEQPVKGVTPAEEVTVKKVD